MHPVTASGTAGRRPLSLEAILRILPVSVTALRPFSEFACEVVF